jgi:hypothetical protein
MSVKLADNFQIREHSWPCLFQKMERASLHLVQDSSAVRRLFARLAGAVGRQSALHKENSGFATPTPGRHISTILWLSDFYFLSETLI